MSLAYSKTTSRMRPEGQFKAGDPGWGEAAADEGLWGALQDGSYGTAAIDDTRAADRFTTMHQSKLVRSESMLPAAAWQPHKRKSFGCLGVQAQSLVSLAL